MLSSGRRHGDEDSKLALLGGAENEPFSCWGWLVNQHEVTGMDLNLSRGGNLVIHLADFVFDLLNTVNYFRA